MIGFFLPLPLVIAVLLCTGIGKWTFGLSTQPGMKKANSQSALEFLRIGIIHALTGEPPQNSMDARDDKSKPVRVEFGIWNGERSLPRSESIRYFGEELVKHLNSGMQDGDEISLSERRKAIGEEMSWLTIEDFNAVGLEGEIDQFDLPNTGMLNTLLDKIRKNRFFWFTRAQNATTEDQDRRGSWGEGKFTLEAASRIGAQISWSIRKSPSNPEQVLMGQTTLRWHNLRGGTDKHGKVDWLTYSPFGVFSTTEPGDAEGNGYAPLPLTEKNNPDVLIDFRKTFNMIRKDEPGLSIMIPQPKEELMDADSLARGIISRWLPAIHEGILEVNIRHNGFKKHMINKDGLRDTISKLNWTDEREKIGSKNELNPAYRTTEQWNKLLDLMDFAENPVEENSFDCRRQDKASWVNPFRDYSEEELEEIRTKFESGETIRIIARPVVKPAGKPAEEGRLEIILAKCDPAMSTQLFARDRMVIPFSPRGIQGVIAFVHCKDNILEKLLRHAEGPAHLEWSSGAHRIVKNGNRWKNGNAVVKFANNSVERLLSELKKSEVGKSHPLPLFEFKIPGPSTPAPDPVQVPDPDPNKPTPPSPPPPPPPPPPPSSNWCNIPSKRTGGNVGISSKKEVDCTGEVVKFYIAYDRHRGNPFTKHSEHDFAITDGNLTGSGLISVSHNSVKKKGYEIVVKVTDSKWKLNIGGLSEDRDVIVNAVRGDS